MLLKNLNISRAKQDKFVEQTALYGEGKTLHSMHYVGKERHCTVCIMWGRTDIAQYALCGEGKTLHSMHCGEGKTLHSMHYVGKERHCTECIKNHYCIMEKMNF
jgi:hypothetical protein